MTQDEIRAIVVEVAKDVYGTVYTPQEIDFATRFLAAINAKAEPDIYVSDTGQAWDAKKNPELKDRGYVGYFAHPVIEPAPQHQPCGVDMSSLAEMAETVGAAPLCSECGVLTTHYKHRTTCRQGATPLPDEVTKMVEQLRNDANLHVMKLTPGLLSNSADMIERLARDNEDMPDMRNEIAWLKERLARQVPPDCLSISTVTKAWYSTGQDIRGGSLSEFLIAAGVKP